MELMKHSDSVLILHENDEFLRTVIEQLNGKTKNITSKRPLEILNSLDQNSNFDFVITGTVAPYDINHDYSLLSVILKTLKPFGTLCLCQPVGSSPLLPANQFILQLQIAGFIKISEPHYLSLTEDEKNYIKNKFQVTDDVTVMKISCCKPNFEVGSSVPLKLPTKKETKDLAAVWKLDDMLDDDVETINPDNLLDDIDLKKPDSSSLKVCNTTGKRKACKDCSCGLADELQAEITDSLKTESAPKSSCGSCYLGDAFRCAACPYLGMPAFKPGEKIQLSNNQLQSDT